MVEDNFSLILYHKSEDPDLRGLLFHFLNIFFSSSFIPVL